MKHPPFKYVEWDKAGKPHITFWNNGKNQWTFGLIPEDKNNWTLWTSLDAKIDWTHASKEYHLSSELMRNLITNLIFKDFTKRWAEIRKDIF